MTINTDIKFYVSSNTGAPQITNAFGTMINILDACLINGFGSLTISSLTYSNSIATATFSAAHNFLKHQVIKIVGANQTEYNIETKVLTIPDVNTITFKLNAVPSVTIATGNITCSLSPLGWEKPFSSTTALGGGRAAYRSKNQALSNRPFLRVIDEKITAYNGEFVKYAKVGIVENMTGIDTMSGVQAPYTSSATTRNWNATGSGDTVKNGWSKWYYYNLDESWSDNTRITDYSHKPGTWLVIGTTDYFYIFTSVTSYEPTPDTPDFKTLEPSFVYGFGRFIPIGDDDLFNHFLASTLQWESAQYISYRVSPYGDSIITGSDIVSNSYNYANLLLQRGYKKSNYSLATCSKVSKDGSGMFSGFSSNMSLPENSPGVVLQTPLILEVISDSLFLPRGFLPLIKTIPHKNPYNEYQIIEQNGKAYICKIIYGNSSNRGAVLLELGDI